MRLVLSLAFTVLLLCSTTAPAAVGYAELTSTENPITVFYPSNGEAKPLSRGPFTLNVARYGEPVRGNGRLIVISHGSGSSAYVHSDLAIALVNEGFVVAIPEHEGDNYKDFSSAGPDSWKTRPVEVSKAIDAIGRDARFAPLLTLDKVGMYGMSAGGHTALVLAGGRWSPSKLKEHCEVHLEEDFQTCVGLAGQLTGGFFDGFKKRVARWAIRYKLSDENWYTHTDPRIAAVVAGVPFAVDFDMASLEKPRVPTALVTAPRDKWLLPKYHSEQVLQRCKTCEHLIDIPNGNHGALLSPTVPGLTGLLGELMNDPPDFDRTTVAEVDRRIVAYFRKHLEPSK